jgi:hypothetical protein
LRELCEIHSLHERAGFVKTELSEKFVQEIEKCLILAGAESYEQGMQKFGKLLEFMQKAYDPMRSKEQFIAVLNQLPEPSLLERLFIQGGMKYLPQVIRFGLKELSKSADETFPAIPRGRTGVDLQTKAKMISFVGQRHMTGYSLEQAKKSAAKHFCMSESTVQRVWDDRGSIGEIDFRSVLKYLADGPGPE